jgi:hypothetical protein
MKQRGAEKESCERSNGDLIKRVCGHGFLSVSEGGRLGTSNKRMCVFGRFEGVLPPSKLPEVYCRIRVVSMSERKGSKPTGRTCQRGGVGCRGK